MSHHWTDAVFPSPIMYMSRMSKTVVAVITEDGKVYLYFIKTHVRLKKESIQLPDFILDSLKL